MLDPFEPVEPWTEEKHRAWAEAREAGQAPLIWRGIGLKLRGRWGMVALGWVAIIVLLVCLIIFTGESSSDQLELLIESIPMLLLLAGCAFGSVIFAAWGTVIDRWERREKQFKLHESPESVAVTLAGPGDGRLFALTNTRHFAGTCKLQLLGFADGAWAPIHTSVGGPWGADLVWLPGGELALICDDQSLLVIGPDGTRTIATAVQHGYGAPLGEGRLLVAGYELSSKRSARVDLLSGAVEPLDLLVDVPPAAHAGRAFLFDHGRYQLAIVGEGPPELIAHSQVWRPIALSVAPDGTLYAAVMTRSGGEVMIWAHGGEWRQLAKPPFTFVMAMAHDGPTLLALAEEGIYRLEPGEAGWAKELSERPITLFSWRLRPLGAGVAALDTLSGQVLLRRGTAWEPLPPVPAFVAQGGAAEPGRWPG